MTEKVAPLSREAEIAARLKAGYPAHDVSPRDGYVSPLDDLRYLLAQLQQAQQELQHWRTSADDHGHTDAHSWSLTTDDLKDQLQQAREALGTFGKHTSECALQYSREYSCTCGLDAALKAVR